MYPDSCTNTHHDVTDLMNYNFSTKQKNSNFLQINNEFFRYNRKPGE